MEGMRFTIDIDTGGTFTDGFVQSNGRTEIVKVDTTPHDLTVCFMHCIEEAADRFGLATADDLLACTEIIRLSTTIGTNTLLQAAGPKLGLIVTRLAGENGYIPGEEKNPAIDFVIGRDMIAGIDEDLAVTGASVEVPKLEDVLTNVKHLLERGARTIVVSLQRAPMNPLHEQICKELVLEDYPTHYLGSVPLLLSSDLSADLHDSSRTNAALVNAYIHRQMFRYLYKADEDIRNRRCKRPLLIVHSTGGVARVSKTKAIDTLDSGPTAALFGASSIAKLYGLENVISLDVGGTSTDIGFISHGEPPYTMEKDFASIPVRMRALEAYCIGGGGGSIARVKDGRLEVGPESAGSTPGPACYGLGGAEPTVTDAWVILGYIDPGYFLGGRRQLNPALAREAVNKVAVALEMGLEETAVAIVTEVQKRIAEAVEIRMREKAIKAEDWVLFGFGGAGGLLCDRVAKEIGSRSSYVFPFGAAFGAFGASCMDVLHNYSSAVCAPLTVDTAEETSRTCNETVQKMVDAAYADMEGEGYQRKNVNLSLELAVSSEDSPDPAILPWASMSFDSGDIEALRKLYFAGTGMTDSGGSLILQEVRLNAVCPLGDVRPPSSPQVGESPEGALKGRRDVFWDGGMQPVDVYALERLQCGNVVRGLALVESEDTTVLVPAGRRYVVDQYLNGMLLED